MPWIRGTLLVCLTHALVLARPAPANAQPVGADINLQAFRPAIDSRGFLTVNSPSTLEHGCVSFGLVTSWGRGVLRFENAGRVYEVQHLLSPTLVGAVGLRLAGLRLELGASVPFHIMAGDRSPDDDGGTPSDPNDDEQYSFDGQGMGDVSLHLKSELLEQSRSGIGLGLVGSLSLATATRERAWLGDGKTVAQLSLAVERQFHRLRMAANAGFRYRPEGTDEYRDSGNSGLPFTGGVIGVGSVLPFGAAAAYALSPGRLEAVAEVFGAMPLDGENYLPLEALLGAKVYLAESSYLTLGAGVGLAPDEGANPDARAFLGIVFEPRRKYRERTRVPDPDLPPPPPPKDGDRDRDDILDVDDACPDDPEDFDEFEDQDGCPDIDNDGDQILDVDDLCPNEPEDVDRFEDSDGCPDVDNDQDQILDVDDKCPQIDGEDRKDTAEVFNGKDDDDGCPDGRIRMGHTVIVILDKIHFEYDSDVIRSESFPILDEIANTLLMNDRIRLVEVQGHTDERGREAYNLDLSQRRAASVVAYLARGGVAAGRLEPRGYGEGVPKNHRHNERAWAENRRVEFHIIDQASGSR